jgi:hypothetical protein
MELNSMINDGSKLEVASISKSLEASNLPLHECLDEKSIWFLTVCGLNWKKRPYYAPVIWSVVVLLCASIFYIVYGLLDVVILVIVQGSFHAYLLVYGGLTLQGIAAIFIIVHSRERMLQIVNKIDLFVFPESRRVALLCLLIFFVTYLPFLIYFNVLGIETELEAIYFSLGVLASSALLSVNLLFLIVDAKVSMSLLTSLTEQDSITVEEYE